MRPEAVGGWRLAVSGWPENGHPCSPDEIFEATAAAPETRGASTLKEYRDKAERDFILDVVRRHAGNISQSAVELGVRRTYLHRRLAQLGISKKDYFG